MALCWVGSSLWKKEAHVHEISAKYWRRWKQSLLFIITFMVALQSCFLIEHFTRNISWLYNILCWKDGWYMWHPFWSDKLRWRTTKLHRLYMCLDWQLTNARFRHSQKKLTCGRWWIRPGHAGAGKTAWWHPERIYLLQKSFRIPQVHQKLHRVRCSCPNQDRHHKRDPKTQH